MGDARCLALVGPPPDSAGGHLPIAPPRCIEGFILADGICFQPGSLSIETLDRGRSDRNAYEQSHHLTFHDFLLFACQFA
jgi:hypothetical protein